MFGKQSVEVIVKSNGETTIEGQGFKGGMCAKVTAFLEKALGTITGRVIKNDMFKKDENQCQLH